MSFLFLKSIQHLRQHEELILYAQFTEISVEEVQETVAFLDTEYARETLEYPHTPPAFDGHAAAWAAQIVYASAQLLLHRENKLTELQGFLPEFKGIPTASAILSADLTLRFLPDVIRQLKVIDSEDGLADLLEKQLTVWHYSGVGYPLVAESLTFDGVAENPCLLQLYSNRVVANRQLSLAQHPLLNPKIKADLGLYATELWKTFSKTT